MRLVECIELFKIEVKRKSEASSSFRASLSPPLPTFFPGLDLQPWMSIVGPAGLPAPIAARLNGALNKALAEPAFAQRLAEVGLAALPTTVDDFGEFIKRDAVRWAELVRSSGAKAE